MSAPPHLSHAETGGNTESARPAKDTLSKDVSPKISSCQCYRWFATLSNRQPGPEPAEPGEPRVRPLELWNLLNEWCKEFYFQLEIGKGGFEHYQLCFSLKVKHRLSEVKNILGFNDIHLESVKDWQASIKYCQKLDTRHLGPWSHKIRPITTITNLRPWQSEVVDIVRGPADDRTIWWFWDRKGATGKSQLCRYLTVHYKARYLTNAKSGDLAFAVSPSDQIILFDFSRSIEGHINYSAIESIKNGLVFSPKYESGTKVFDPPHVLCFANFPPKSSALSDDRLSIICLDS